MAMGCKKELLMKYHKVEPVKAIDKYNSRFAYKIHVRNRPIAGLWKLDGVNVSKGTAIYKRLDGRCRRK